MGWLTYTNQGATRNLPLSKDLVNAMSFLPDMGLGMEVFSGGQPSTGPHRVGSHRHDWGGAGDVFFTKDGRRLDFNNPADLPYYKQIVTKAKGRGVTGFGAGPGYMARGSMHLGFGPEAVWGATKGRGSAPGWLRAAASGDATSHFDAPLKVTSDGSRALVDKDMSMMLAKGRMEDMKPKIEGTNQASIDPRPVTEWPANGSPFIKIDVDTEKEKRKGLRGASEALADAAAEMDKGKDAAWAWVAEAMRPRIVQSQPMWLGSPLWS